MSDIERSSGIKAILYVTPGAPNAFALNHRGRPTIGITTGMLELVRSPAEYAAILGHEIAHLKLNHPLKAQINAILSDVSGRAVRKGNGNTTTKIASLILIKAVSTKFTRDQERDSDSLGLVWAMLSGYNPNGAAQVHRKLIKRGNRIIPWLRTHPSNTERVSTLSALAKKLSSRNPGIDKSCNYTDHISIL